jgi:hypothetical protein
MKKLVTFALFVLHMEDNNDILIKNEKEEDMQKRVQPRCKMHPSRPRYRCKECGTGYCSHGMRIDKKCDKCEEEKRCQVRQTKEKAKIKKEQAEMRDDIQRIRRRRAARALVADETITTIEQKAAYIDVIASEKDMTAMELLLKKIDEQEKELAKARGEVIAVQNVTEALKGKIARREAFIMKTTKDNYYLRKEKATMAQELAAKTQQLVAVGLISAMSQPSQPSLPPLLSSSSSKSTKKSFIKQEDGNESDGSSRSTYSNCSFNNCIFIGTSPPLQTPLSLLHEQQQYYDSENEWLQNMPEGSPLTPCSEEG